MTTHRNSVGETDEWFTPPEIFDALGCRFDLDPCQPASGRTFLSVPADRFLTPAEDGLTSPWSGFVWLNPPFGGRNGIVPWLKRFVDHGNGVALATARTSAGWFHDFAPLADAMLFPRGKTKFIRPNGTRGDSPHDGIVLFAKGAQAVCALRQFNPGVFFEITPPDTVGRGGKS